jgi:hypothetical protein
VSDLVSKFAKKHKLDRAKAIMLERHLEWHVDKYYLERGLQRPTGDINAKLLAHKLYEPSLQLRACAAFIGYVELHRFKMVTE